LNRKRWGEDHWEKRRARKKRVFFHKNGRGSVRSGIWGEKKSLTMSIEGGTSAAKVEEGV